MSYAIFFPKVCILCDDKHIADELKKTLRQFELHIVDSFLHADCVLLQITSFNRQIYELISDIRASCNVPIIIFDNFGNYDLDNISKLYEMGIDSYLTLPIIPMEIYYRILVWKKRYSGRSSNSEIMIYKGAHLSFNELILPDGTKLYFRPFQYVLISIFFKSPEEVLSINEVMTQVYGDRWTYFQLRSLSVVRSALNKKLRLMGLNITSINRTGFILEPYKKQKNEQHY